MDEARQLTVSLRESDELREAVDGGEYPDVDAVVSAALESWSADRMIARIGLEKLRQHWTEGLASGDGQPLDPESLMRGVMSRIGRSSGPK